MKCPLQYIMLLLSEFITKCFFLAFLMLCFICDSLMERAGNVVKLLADCIECTNHSSRIQMVAICTVISVIQYAASALWLAVWKAINPKVSVV